MNLLWEFYSGYTFDQGEHGCMSRTMRGSGRRIPYQQGGVAKRRRDEKASRCCKALYFYSRTVLG